MSFTLLTRVQPTKLAKYFYSVFTISSAWMMMSPAVVLAIPQSCIEFIQPAQWTAVKSPSCTLSVYACAYVTSIHFKTQYIPENDSLSRIVSIGHITRRPFKLIWDISEIPNQLTYGITCIIEAEISDGKKETRKQEGIFLAHNPIISPKYKVPYSRKKRFSDIQEPILLSSPSLSSEAQVYCAWNEKTLRFHIEVTNPLFYTTLPESKLNKLGIKISIDPQNKRYAYLSEDICIFMIPVTNKPYTIVAKSRYSPEGSFDIKESHNSCVYPCTVTNEDFKGYTVDFSIPQKILGTPLPQSISCNIIATVLDENTKIKPVSWVQGNHYVIHSPQAYGTLTLGRKPYLTSPFLLWFICLVLGIIIGVIGILLYKLARKFNTLLRFENSEQEEGLIKNIITIIEAEITNKDFSINDIAARLSLPPGKINKIIKRYVRKNFKKHLLYSRIEIVKERLRSSNASETSIAQSCGFNSVSEMEKIFHSFTGSTPYRYREDNRIT